MHGVDVHQRTDRMCAPRDPGHRVDRADGIGREADRDDARPLRDLPLKVVGVQRAVVGTNVDGAQRQSALPRNVLPRVHVCLVVQHRHDDLVAVAERRPDRAARRKRQRRHVRAELDLVGRGGTQECRHGDVGVREDLVAAAARLEVAAGVGVRVAQIAPDRVDDALRHLRPTRTVEKHDRPAVLLSLQRRKL
jgi:hypothetical protein